MLLSDANALAGGVIAHGSPTASAVGRLMCHRIALVTLRCIPAPLAGAERFMWFLSRELAQKGHDVSILVSNTRRSWFNPLHRLRKMEVVDLVKIIRFENFYPVSGFFRGLRLFHVPNELVDILSRGPFMPGLYLHIIGKSQAYDVVHATPFPLGYVWLASLAAREAGIPFVITPHLKVEFPIYYSRYLRAILKKSAAVMAVTNTEKDLIARMGVPSRRIYVIPMGMDTREWMHASGDEFREKHDISELDSVILVPSTDYERGAIHVLGALDLIRNHVKNLVVVTMGFPSRIWLREASRRKNLRIIDLGWVDGDEKKDVFDACDILCQPSRDDSYGTVYLEAWIRNKPVIGARIGPIREIIADGTNGFLVQFGDIEELAMRILQLIEDRSLRERLGLKGREFVLERHDWGKVSEQVEAVYESVVHSCGK